jgi:peroxiredoxin Q/BCP
MTRPPRLPELAPAAVTSQGYREEDAGMTLKVGDPAPNFALEDQAGAIVKLSDFRGKKVVLYFSTRAGAPRCLERTLALRAVSPDLEAAGAVVVGVSPDAPHVLALLDTKNDLGFRLLSDPIRATMREYGLLEQVSRYGNSFTTFIRSVFVIDEEGRVKTALLRVIPESDTVPKVLEALQR